MIVSWLLFCIAFHIVIALLKYRSFTLLKALAKSNAYLFAIAIVGRAINFEREPSKKKQRTETKKDAKRVITLQ